MQPDGIKMPSSALPPVTASARPSPLRQPRQRRCAPPRPRCEIRVVDSQTARRFSGARSPPCVASSAKGRIFSADRVRGIGRHGAGPPSRLHRNAALFASQRPRASGRSLRRIPDANQAPVQAREIRNNNPSAPSHTPRRNPRRMIELTRSEADPGPLHVAIMHADAPQDADSIRGHRQ